MIYTDGRNVYTQSAINSIVNSVSHSGNNDYNFKNFYNATQRTDYCGLIVFMRVFTTVSNGIYLLNLCSTIGYTLIAGADNADFTFDVNTGAFNINIKSGFGSLTSSWYTILG